MTTSDRFASQGFSLDGAATLGHIAILAL